jgi:hypothetical protein
MAPQRLRIVLKTLCVVEVVALLVLIACTVWSPLGDHTHLLTSVALTAFVGVTCWVMGFAVGQTTPPPGGQR